MKFRHNELYRMDFPSVTTAKGRVYDIDGSKYPSITTVLGSEVAEGLLAWRQSVGTTRADKITREAAELGTILHGMFEHYLQNNEIVPAEYTIQQISMFNKLKLYLNKINDIECQENVLFSDTLKIAGRVDCIGVYNGTLSVIDFKTASRTKSAEIIENYFIQASAYAWMFYEMFEVEITQIVIIIAVDNGLPQVFIRDPRDYYEALIEKVDQYYESRQPKQ